MVVRVERSVEVPASPATVWEFLADPRNRAEAVSVVREAEVHDDDTVTWYVEIPLPIVDRTIPVHTEDEVQDPPNRGEWVGRATGLSVEGEHVVSETESGARVENRFVVESSIPGVEAYFERNLDRELDNLTEALLAAVGGSS